MYKLDSLKDEDLDDFINNLDNKHTVYKSNKNFTPEFRRELLGKINDMAKKGVYSKKTIRDKLNYVREMWVLLRLHTIIGCEVSSFQYEPKINEQTPDFLVNGNILIEVYSPDKIGEAAKKNYGNYELFDVLKRRLYISKSIECKLNKYSKYNGVYWVIVDIYSQFIEANKEYVLASLTGYDIKEGDYLLGVAST